ncbi:RNA polymerase sigma factor [uncultured Chloroflexus sp.]|uniref:RNA polymerase sigma factor n=1 Tax=uncultured Chloroflexus sp. TaxID=214040 RepID=UPI0026316F8A|nr:sigma-70 family RNA polymerase sigma factor [uncultured Chloroflexus sp.]
MTTPSHHDIVAGLRRRDPQIVSWIYETYGPQVYRYLYRRLGDADLAQDAHGEVFVRLLERAAQYEDRGAPVAAWLFRLARDQAVTTLRRARRVVSLERDQWPLAVEDPVMMLEQVWDKEEMQQVLGRLPEHYRQILALRFEAGLSIEDAARQLGRSVSATKAVQHRAIKWIRERLGVEVELLPNPTRAYRPPMA